MSRIEAIFRGGVFQPLEPVTLPEDQRVQISYKPTNGHPLQTWLNEVQAVQAAIIQRQGILPDSTSEIAADRMR